MNKNYNPYTVPQGFFEESCTRAVDSFKRRRRVIRHAMLSAAVVALLAFVPVLARQLSGTSAAGTTEMQADNLAEMYDYDIFLQVSF